MKLFVVLACLLVVASATGGYKPPPTPTPTPTKKCTDWKCSVSLEKQFKKDIEIDVMNSVKNSITNEINNKIKSDVWITGNAAESSSDAEAFGTDTKTVTTQETIAVEDFGSTSTGFSAAAAN
eukprot:TRINITY_DN1875_c2_g1_i3.p3 TRINITY_DN1875_c2_g1~~TRINITY_DN1875_c2_g1_i3.p3  ORF type:complete len:123 (+),score=35.56 TRINITY_DN1875_c2_g1_i3:169-537(+)